jgi:hypothetical protein
VYVCLHKNSLNIFLLNDPMMSDEESEECESGDDHSDDSRTNVPDADTAQVKSSAIHKCIRSKLTMLKGAVFKILNPPFDPTIFYQVLCG